MSSRSSIFSFNFPVKGDRWPLAGLLAALFVILLNTVAVVLPIDDYLPSPYFPRHEVSQKYMTLKTYIANGENPDVIFVGSSIADMGFDAIEFEKVMKKAGRDHVAFNFGINGAGPGVHLEILRHILTRETRIKYLIYGICLIELNSSSATFLSDQQTLLDSPYFEAERDRFFLKGDVKKFLFNHFKLFRISESLWPNYFTADASWINTRLFKFKYKGQNRLLPGEYRNWSENLRGYEQYWAKKDILRLEELFGNYVPYGSNMEDLRKLIEFTREMDIKLIIVNMPALVDPKALRGTVYHRMIEPTASGKTPMELYEKVLKDMHAQYQFTFLDMGGRSNYYITDFHDPLHLYHTGAKKLAYEVAEHFTQTF